MSHCLLCGQDLPQTVRFTDIVFLRRPLVGACSDCWAGFEQIAEHRCPTCCKPYGEEDAIDQSCSDCLYWLAEGEVVDHLALYSYNGAMKSYFSRYKFFGDYLLAQLFAKDIKDALKPYKDYTLVPVPVSAKTYEERGFNQVEGLLQAAGLPYQNLLTKGEGAKQSSKSRQERLLSRPDYQILPEKSVPPKIFLVDDIYTTGATIAVIKGILRENGAEIVKTFSLSR